MQPLAPNWIVSHKATADIGYRALIPAVVTTALALVTVVLRLYSRVRLSHAYGVEDLFVTMAMISAMVFTAIVGGEFHLDTNNTNGEVRASLVEPMMRLVYAQSLVYQFAGNLVKLSILLQYQHIFRHIRRLNFLIQCLGYVTLAVLTWGVFDVILLCDPVQKYWQADFPGVCMNEEGHFWSTSLMGIILDVAIWTLPIPVLGWLKLESRQKMELLVPFGLGLFACVVAILKLVLVHKAALRGDVTESGTHAIIWSITEVNVAIMCSSLLVMKPLLVRIVSRLGTNKPPSAGENDGNIRRMMAPARLETAVNGTVDSSSDDSEGIMWSDGSEDGVDIRPKSGCGGCAV